jgi:hypothetical protein
MGMEVVTVETKLVHVQKRIDDLEALANEVAALAARLKDDEKVQPDLSVNGQRWYRGAREILVQAKSSALEEFDQCYDSSKVPLRPGTTHRGGHFTDIEQYISIGTHNSWDQRHWFGDEKQQNRENYHGLFCKEFQKARALLLSVIDEIWSRELPVKTQLSFELVADEFATAERILQEAKGQEVFHRVSGVIARVALERHLFTVADQRAIVITVNPPQKKKPEAQDAIVSLRKAAVITAIQQSQLEMLFKIGNNCAHPQEIIDPVDIEKMINEGKHLASVIL